MSGNLRPGKGQDRDDNPNDPVIGPRSKNHAAAKVETCDHAMNEPILTEDKPLGPHAVRPISD